MTDLHTDAFDPAGYDPEFDEPSAPDLEVVSSRDTWEGLDVDYYGEDGDDLDDLDDYYEG